MLHDSPHDLMIVWVVCLISLLALVHNFVAVAWPRLPCGMGFLIPAFFKLRSIGSACLFLFAVPFDVGDISQMATSRQEAILLWFYSNSLNATMTCENSTYINCVGNGRG